MMCDTKGLEKKPFRHMRISFLFPVLILLAALWLGGCAKDSGVSSVAEPERSSAALVTEVPETTAAIPETSSEAATPVPETTTTIQEPTTTAQETTTAEPAVAPSESTTAIPETTELIPESTPALPEDSALIRRRGGDPAGEIIDLLPLPEIPYERPDMEGLFADMDALAVQVGTTDDVRAVINAYKDINQRMTYVRTMYSLAAFRYSQDVTGSYYGGEYDYLSSQIVIMNQKRNELLYAMGDSPLRSRLESAYFGRRYFEYNGKEQNEAYLELIMREEDLIDQYRKLMAVQEVTFQGETKSLNEWLESESAEVRGGVQAARMKEYHEPLGRLYLELVKVRHQIALSRGYDNYLSYAFKGIYYRDYSPARAGEFYERVKTHLVPVLKELYEQESDSALPASLLEDPMGHLAAAAEEMGGSIWEAYRFMDAYDLCDAEPSPTKREEAYTDYLREYELPVIFLNPTLFGVDLALPHEFGHFVDSYLDYGQSSPNEINEAISTAMEYLAIAYDPLLNQEERMESLRAVLESKVMQYIGWECAYADFEGRVYERNPEELTLEELDEMYFQCLEDYGLRSSYPEEIARGSWIRVRHFFEYPEYVLSYCVANIISMQIINLEAINPGAGLESFLRLVEGGSPWAGVDAITRNVKLQSPFASETLKQIADFLREALELPSEEE